MSTPRVADTYARLLYGGAEPPRQQPERELFTDGEYLTLHLMENGENYTESFKELVESITARFTAGEWQEGKEKLIAGLIADIDPEDRGQLYRALAIDAFLARSTAEELTEFNRLKEYAAAQELRKDPADGYNKIHPLDLTYRGFNNGIFKEG